MFDRAMWQVNQERHGELLKVADAQRLTKKTKTKSLPVRDAFIVNVGELLVSFGMRLKARHESPLP